MKKNFLLAVCSFFIVAGSSAQLPLPPYYQVLKKFFTTYTAGSEYDNYTAFTRKKDGWYVTQINRIKNDELLKEQLFWSSSQGKYLDISADYKATEDSADFENKIEPYLDYTWYNYDRIPLYGYNNWAQDMINVYGGRYGLSDTLLDALGRSYDNNGLAYSWYQQGGNATGNDTLQSKLGRLQLPSKERVERMKNNFDNAIAQFEKLSKLNPNYQTIVGNAGLKLFNEYMHAANQMYMCGNNEEAKKYIDKITLDERYINQAKNYLNSCDVNAILFTYGDNDTYQLWYVQEKLGYRKDVAVINTSLLGVPAYVMMLKKNKVVSFSTPLDHLKDASADVAYYQESKNKTKPTLTLTEFLKIIYTRKYPFKTSEVFDRMPSPSYPVNSAVINTPLAKNKTIKIKFNNYLFISDLLMLDIIDVNLLKRPVYFTTGYSTFFDNYLTQSGIVFKININRNTQLTFDAAEIKALENYLTTKHIPVVSDYKIPTSFVSFDGDNTLAATYAVVIQYYLYKKDMVNSKKWSNLLLKKIAAFSPEQVSSFRFLAALFLQSDQKDFAKKIMEAEAEWVFDAYKNPASLKGFYSYERCNNSIRELAELLYKNGMEESTVISNIRQQLIIE